MRIILICSLLMIGLTACAGRNASPVAIHNAYDEQLSCQQVRAEIAVNSEKIHKVEMERLNSRTRNYAVGAVSLVFWPALFALDVSRAERDEIGAMKARNENLDRMLNDGRCHQTT